MLVPQQRSLRYTQFVIPAGKRVSSAMDGDLKYIHVVWIPAIPAEMTGFVTLVYNDESSAGGYLSFDVNTDQSRDLLLTRVPIR